MLSWVIFYLKSVNFLFCSVYNNVHFSFKFALCSDLNKVKALLCIISKTNGRCSVVRMLLSDEV